MDSTPTTPAAFPPNPVFYVGERERSMDKQGRLQLPSEWLYDGQKQFIVSIGQPDREAVAFFPPQVMDAMIPQLGVGDHAREPLREMAKAASTLRPVTVDSNNRVSLTDPDIRSRLAPTGEAGTVKLFGASRYFFAVRAEAYDPIVEDLKQT